MNENIEEEAYKLMSVFRRITPIFLMRKFKLNADMANKICDKIALRKHLEMRKFVKESTDGNG
jgi:hypothetical protein